MIPLENVRDYYVALTFLFTAMQENHPMCVLEAAGAAGLPMFCVTNHNITAYDAGRRCIIAKTDDEFLS